MIRIINSIKQTIFPLAILAIIFRIITSRFIWGCVCGWMFLVLVFFTYRGYENNLPENMIAVAQSSAENVARKLPAYDITNISNILVFPLKGPNGAVVTDYIRDALYKTGRYSVMGQGYIGEILRMVKFDLSKSGVAEAIETGKRLGVDGVITGEVKYIDGLGSEPELAYEIILTDVVKPEQKYVVEYVSGSSGLDNGSNNSDSKEVIVKAEADSGNKTSRFSRFAVGLVLFVVFAVFMQILVFPRMRKYGKKADNFNAIFMLIGLAIIDTFVGLFLFDLSLQSVLSFIIVLLILVFSLVVSSLTCYCLKGGGGVK